jgi:quercetin dioxygenase-like cupin family protein
VQSQPRKPTIKGPGDWFTGDVWIDPIVQPDGHSQLNVGAVHFAPGARTAWHSHDGGQTLYVTEGRGRVQASGEDAVEVRAGDVHVTPDGQQHWHGAGDEHFMTHISITQGPATWGEHVTDDEYLGPTDE